MLRQIGAVLLSRIPGLAPPGEVASTGCVDRQLAVEQVPLLLQVQHGQHVVRGGASAAIRVPRVRKMGSLGATSTAWLASHGQSRRRQWG